MFNEIQEQIKFLNNMEYRELLTWILNDEKRRRESEASNAELIGELREEGQLNEAPEVTKIETLEEASADVASYPAWVNPGTIHSKMYLRGDVVQHNGRVWISNHQGLNHWEPGGVGVYEFVWADITDKLGVPVTNPEEEVTEPTDPTAPEEEETPSSPEGTRENPIQWTAGLSLKKGQIVTLDGKLYELVQDHNSASHWTPGSPGLESIYKTI